MTMYNKDKEYTLKVADTSNNVKEIKFTPDRDMSKPELIMALKSKYKNFFKLLESSRVFKTSVVDKNGNELLLSDASYNNACYWLEKMLSKNGRKITNAITDIKNPNITIIKTDAKVDYIYNEEDGTLKILNESKLEESYKMEFEPLPDSLKKEICNIEEMYQEDMLNDEDDVFGGTEDSYADEMLQQHIFDLFDEKDMKLYMMKHYDTTTQELANESANFVANTIYNAIIEENTDSLFAQNTSNKKRKEEEPDQYEFIANVDALYDKYGENVPSGCTIQLSLGNKYLFSKEYHNGKDPVCCNGEHCRLMWVYGDVCGIKNLHYKDCSFELVKDEFLLLSSFTVPLTESKNANDKVDEIVNSDDMNSVIVVNYGEGTRFPSRNIAIDYYKECVAGTDSGSSENYGYQNILYELINTDKDVVYDFDDEEEYNWWVSRGKPVEDISDELLKAHINHLDESNNSDTNKTLNELLLEIGSDGFDIGDATYDSLVYFPLIDDVVDSYDSYIKQLGDSLIVKEAYEDGDSSIVVGLYEYVQENKDKLLSVINVSNLDDDEDVYEYLVCDVMPALISGNATDSVYDSLL